MPQSHPLKLLIWRLSSIGDVIKATSILERLKAESPNTEVHWAIREDAKSLLENDPRIHKLWIVPKKASLAWLKDELIPKLKAENFDGFVDAHASLRSQIIANHLKIPSVKLAKNRFRKNLLFSARIPTSAWRPHYESAKLLDHWLGETQKEYFPSLIFDEKQSSEIFRTNKIRKLPSEKFSLAIIPGAAHEKKLWQTDYWESFLNKLKTENSQWEFHLFGTVQDPVAVSLAKRKDIMSWVGKLSLSGSLLLAAKCQYAIGVDTGLIHGIEALGKPTAIILGPTGLETGAYPFLPLSAIIERQIFCRPCSKDGSAPCIWGLGSQRCLRGLKPDQVFYEFHDWIDEIQSGLS